MLAVLVDRMQVKRIRGLLAALIIACLALVMSATMVRAQFNSADEDTTMEGLSGDQNMGEMGTGAGEATGSPFEQAAQRLGMSADQLAEIRGEMSQGMLGPDQLDQLCARIAAKHLSSSNVQSIVAMLGLQGEQAEQLMSCVRAAGNRQLTGRTMPFMTLRMQTRPWPPKPSAIEQRFHELDSPYRMLAMPSLGRLKQFGYDLFDNPVSTFAPVDNVPVSADYILGPGDELNLLIWGRVNRKLRLRVERDGSVLVPHIGPLQISGLTFDQAKKLIEGRVGQITGVQVDLTMGQVRTIQVFVVGKVSQPGLYTVSALSHVSNALAAAGGVSRVGSLRRIQLRRNNHIVREIDLYQMLMRGDTSADVRLEPRDAIFVPVIGPVVAVAGDVKSPAIYELRGVESLESVLSLAGGVNAFGYAQRIEVQRVENHQNRVVLDARLDSWQGRRFAIHDGDLVKVFPVLPQTREAVTLRGNVNRPGTYEWRPGMRVTDLVREGQGVADHTYFDYALIQRREGPQRTLHFIPVNLNEALSDELGPNNFPLKPEDSLTIYSQGELNQIPIVTVHGAVRKPGSYPLTEGMKVTDLIYRAGGLKDNAFRQKAELARTEVVAGTNTQYTFRDINLGEALNGSAIDDQPLQAGDELFIQQAANWHEPWSVTVKGEVVRPGPYAIRPGERLASVLQRTGGILPDGYLPALILIRQSVKLMQQRSLNEARARLSQEIARAALTPEETSRQSSNQGQREKTESLAMLQSVLSQAASQQATGRVVVHVTTLERLANSKNNIALEPKDEIIIPRRPSSVNVLGEVYGPTAVAYDPVLTVRDYINRAGGLTQGADKDHVFVVKASGEILTDEGVRESGKNAVFPLLPALSGGLMSAHLQPGDTVYAPEQLVYVNQLQRTLDITQVIANSAQAIAFAALLGFLIP
jgi:protein involved in polysaccharide export with SLBB domain